MTRNSTALRRYQQALDRTERLGTGEALDPSIATFQQRAEFRLDRLREMLTVLGNPLAATPIVHVAGTSGKGSTAAAIASILTSAGYRTGLHTSPYLQVATEKLQIDREMIEATEFANLVDSTLDTLEGEGFHPSYGQLWMAMVLSWLEHERVDIAVIEVGAGGRFDLSNVVHPMISVITEIGYDHMDTLGSTIEEIAWHKAGIIEPFTPVVAALGNRAALKVVAGEASKQGADVHRVIPTQGNFAQTNEATARAAVELLGFAVDLDDIQEGLEQTRLPGRAEIVQDQPRVILDGAHNPQKIEALAGWFSRAYPREKPVVVAGFLESKDARAMLHTLAPLASVLILTEPAIDEKAATTVDRLTALLDELAFDGPVEIEPDARSAVDLALALAHRTGSSVLVTGSLYLVGNVRSRWYPDEDVLLQRTPWPHRGARLSTSSAVNG